MAERQAGDGTVGKALEVLDMVASFERPVRFSEVLDGSPYPKGTLYRLFQTLTNQGMLAFDPDRQTYSLGVRLVRLAHAAWQQSSLAPIARSYLDALSQTTGETVHLAQLDHAQVLYLDKRNALNPIEMYSQAGKVGPAYCTGVGKAMLAFLGDAEVSRIISQQSFHRFTEHTLTTEAALRADLADIRTKGFGMDREEHEPGIICIAAPILTPRGRVLGGLSITSTTAQKTLTDLAALAPQVQAAAQNIAVEAQSWRFPDQATDTIRTET